MTVKNAIVHSGISKTNGISITHQESTQEEDHAAIIKSLQGIGLEHLLEVYEKRAVEVLAELGYPKTIEALWQLELEDLPDRVLEIRSFLSRMKHVHTHILYIKDYLKRLESDDPAIAAHADALLKAAKSAAWSAFQAASAASRAEIQPYEVDIILEPKMKSARKRGGEAKAVAQSKKPAGKYGEWQRQAEEI